MADFDALIKQALKTQNSADPLVREKVYQSSRNALMRMLEKAGNQATDAGKSHLAALENSIARIESEFTPKVVEPAPLKPAPLESARLEPTQSTPSLLGDSPLEKRVVAEKSVVEARAQNSEAPSPSPISSTVSSTVSSGILGSADGELNRAANAPHLQQDTPQINAAPNPAPQVEAPITPPNPQPVQTQAEPVQAHVTGQQSQASQQSQMAQQSSEQYADPSFQQGVEYPQDDYVASDPQPVLNYKRKSPILRRLSTLLIILIVLGVIFWLVFAFITNLSKPTSVTEQQKIQQQQQNDQSSIYLDVLTPSDPSALVTSGRGSAEIITELNMQYLRIQSIRNAPNSTSSAEPILLELQPGVLKKIAGKTVTVEIRTKSGSSKDGLFSIQCLVAGESVCDRKRFPVGQQPENVIFALKLADKAINGDTFLAINTDVKNAVNSDGAGNPIDILYVRVRIAK